MLSLSSSRQLEQSKKRHNDTEKAHGEENMELNEDTPSIEPKIKRRCRSTTDVLHDPHLCLWCMQGKDDKHKDRSKARFFIISSYSAWYRFKRHVTYLDDEDMKERIVRLIDSTEDPFAAEIRYHEKYWLKYTNIKQARENFHTENVDLHAAQNIFFSHVQKVIFEEQEIRTVQGLLADHKIIVGDYGFSTESI